jgi:hypothetical protein
MQRQNNAPPPRRRWELLEEPSAEGALTRAARPTPREATERAGGARRFGQARPRGAAEPPEELRGWLSGRGNLRRAMLLQVVLAPPKALRPDEESG